MKVELIWTSSEIFWSAPQVCKCIAPSHGARCYFNSVDYQKKGNDMITTEMLLFMLLSHNRQ